MQEVSTTITIDVEEFKKLLLDAHDCGRYRLDAYNLKNENEVLRKELEAAQNAADS